MNFRHRSLASQGGAHGEAETLRHETHLFPGSRDHRPLPRHEDPSGSAFQKSDGSSHVLPVCFGSDAGTDGEGFLGVEVVGVSLVLQHIHGKAQVHGARASRGGQTKGPAHQEGHVLRAGDGEAFLDRRGE